MRKIWLTDVYFIRVCRRLAAWNRRAPAPEAAALILAKEALAGRSRTYSMFETYSSLFDGWCVLASLLARAASWTRHPEFLEPRTKFGASELRRLLTRCSR